MKAVNYFPLKSFALIIVLPLIIFQTSCEEDTEVPSCTVGAICDDNNDCTTGETLDDNCICTGGVFQDSDSDGVCNAEDQCPGFDDGLIGTSCDDGDPNTTDDVYTQDCTCEGTFNNLFTDTRDGQVYTIVEIGTQIWFAENLNYDTGNSWCYDNNSSNCDTYGRLYSWNTATAACPTGWHLPTEAEWTTLIDYLGGTAVAGGKMKEAGLDHWGSPNEGATNESGFTALPGGSTNGVGTFFYLGFNGFWWSATEFNATNGWFRGLDYTETQIRTYDGNKSAGYSVRCIQD